MHVPALTACAALALVVASLSPALAADPAPLSGTYVLGGRTLVDPPPGEARDTHMYFTLDGRSARALYESMPAKAVRDVCLDDGSLSKQAGAMQCTRAPGGKTYRCAFGIDLKTQTLTHGAVC